MLNGLQRRYTLEQIEAQDEALIVPRLNYNALKTLRSPLYKKLGQQVTDTSKEQQEARNDHNNMHQTINHIASQEDVNVTELGELVRNLMEPRQNPVFPDIDGDDKDLGGFLSFVIYRVPSLPRS